MRISIFCLLLIFNTTLWSQSVNQLEYELELAKTEGEQLDKSFQLTAAYLKAKAYEKGATHGKKTFDLAKKLGSAKKAGYTALYLAMINEKLAAKDKKKERRYFSAMNNWLRTAQATGKKIDDPALVIHATRLLCSYEAKDRDYRKAYRYAEETLTFLANSEALTGSNSQYEEMQRLRQQIDRLTYERDSLQWELGNQ
jgi:hypothetical protein